MQGEQPVCRMIRVVSFDFGEVPLLERATQESHNLEKELDLNVFNVYHLLK